MPAKMHIPADEDRSRLIRAAIAAMGGITKAARQLGYKTGERVRHFYAPGLPVPAEKCRDFVRMSHGIVDLRTIRPDLYGGLTVTELGYEVRSDAVVAPPKGKGKR
jgi:hypothetical protein